MTDDEAYAVRVLPNGRFLVGGDADGDAAVLKYGPKGGPVHSFGTNGVDSSGRIVAAGYHSNVTDPDQLAVARFLGS